MVAYFAGMSTLFYEPFSAMVTEEFCCYLDLRISSNRQWGHAWGGARGVEYDKTL